MKSISTLRWRVGTIEAELTLYEKIWISNDIVTRRDSTLSYVHPRELHDFLAVFGFALDPYDHGQSFPLSLGKGIFTMVDDNELKTREQVELYAQLHGLLLLDKAQ